MQPFKNRVRDLVLKFEKREGSNCEVVTQMNSADKDPFAVNLLNFRKFIVIHRKFVK